MGCSCYEAAALTPLPPPEDTPGGVCMLEATSMVELVVVGGAPVLPVAPDEPESPVAPVFPGTR